MYGVVLGEKEKDFFYTIMCPGKLALQSDVELVGRKFLKFPKSPQQFHVH